MWKFLEKLKTIGISLPKLEHITLINLSVNIDKSVHADGSTLTINPKKFSGKQRRKLVHFVKTDLLDEAGAIIDQSAAPVVAAVQDSLGEIDTMAAKLQHFIPANDMLLLKACLFLRKRFEAGHSVEGLKTQIMGVYGQRGGNFSNLCSAGYLEDWFLPLYNDLQEEFPGDSASAQAKFRLIYNNILSELPFTEFVSSRTNAARTLSHVLGKIRHNVAVGVRVMNIHGLGRSNVNKVVKILPEIQRETGALVTKIERDSNRIFVRLEVPPKRLTGG